MRSNEYWAKRALKREQESFAKGAELSMRMFKEYERAAKEIRTQVNDFYARYANENGLSFGDAVKLLNRPEKQEWKASIGTWVKRINQEQDEAVKALLKAELDALSYNSQISRLEALYGQIQMILNDLYMTGVKQMKEEFGDLFTEAYYKKVFDIQQRVGFMNEFAKINEGMIEDIVSYPWSGADFSQRLWENKKVLHFHVRETITQGLIQGKSISKMTKDLSDRMGSSFKNAERLIRTETTHFHNEATKTAYDAAGVEEYEYMSTLDTRTSDVCRGLDGKHFKLSEAKVGVNYPPMHPWCRSTTIEYDPEDALDWYNSGQPMPENMTYEEWYSDQIDSLNSSKNGIIEPKSYEVFSTIEEVKQWENGVTSSWLEKLTIEEADAIRKYTGSSYQSINNYLRNGGNDSQMDELIELISSGIGKFNLTDDIIVYRGLSENIFGVPASEMVGIQFMEKAFMSTSLLQSTSFSGLVSMEIRVPSNFKGACINPLSQYQDLEFEFLLDKGTAFEIIEAEEVDGRIKMIVEVILDE